MDQDLVTLAELTLEHALARGAQQAAVGLHRARFVELKRRAGRTEALQASTTRGLAIALYVDGRYSSNSTSFLAEREVRRFVDEALAMTRTLAPDPHRALPDPALYGPTPGVALELADEGYDGRTMEWRESLVAAAEEAARAPGEAVISATAEISTQAGESLQLHSNGFRGERRGTAFTVGVSVTARDAAGRRPEDHSYATARHATDLPDAAELGHEAARRALARVGGRKAESQRTTLLVENRAAARLVSALLEPLTGAALQQRRSCFADRVGQAIGSPLLSLVDEPLLPRGLGSRAYDDEGLRAVRRPLLDAGKLACFLVDVYYGRKLEQPPTSGSTSNLLLPPGARSRGQLLADVQEGILVSSFLGGNSNPATGDFSFGVMGHAVRGGVLAEPVTEMNITASHTTLWQRLSAVGDDPYPYSAWRLPTLVFDDVQFSGV